MNLKCADTEAGEKQPHVRDAHSACQTLQVRVTQAGKLVLVARVTVQRFNGSVLGGVGSSGVGDVTVSRSSRYPGELDVGFVPSESANPGPPADHGRGRGISKPSFHYNTIMTNVIRVNRVSLNPIITELQHPL